MEYIRWVEPPESVALVKPVAAIGFSGWNDAGQAASTALGAIIASTQARLIAEVDPEVFTDFGTVRPEIEICEGERLLVWPTVRIYAAHMPGCDAVLVLGPEPSLRWRLFSEVLVDVFERLGVDLLVAVGALLAEVPHTRPTQVIGVSDDQPTIERFDLHRSSYEGPTGIVGIVASAASEAGLPTASLWAAVPSYTAQVAAPAAAVALIDRSCEIMGTPPPHLDTSAQQRTFEHHVAELIGDDDALAVYISRLESIADAEATDAAIDETTDLDRDDFASQVDNADMTTIAAEVEAFLRDRDLG